MRVLVVHSNIAAGAPPDEQDTLVQAAAIAAALRQRGHYAVLHPFTSRRAAFRTCLRQVRPDVVFNVVEAIDGSGYRAARAIEAFDALGLAYTGNPARALTLTCDKPRAKQMLKDAAMPTPGWAVAPAWRGLDGARRYVVKNTLEDASIGLDDQSVVRGVAAVKARAEHCAAQFGGQWFAEDYVDGREFNVAVLEDEGGPVVLPIAEMRFEAWPAGRPKIVGYAAKWDESSSDAHRTVRDFGWRACEPGLDAALRSLSLKAWALFGLRGYARVDFRVGDDGRPTILEINPNPCLEPQAGFAAAAARAGLNYVDLIDRVVGGALNGRDRCAQPPFDAVAVRATR